MTAPVGRTPAGADHLQSAASSSQTSNNHRDGFYAHWRRRRSSPRAERYNGCNRPIWAKALDFSGTPEQVHVRGLFGRRLRLALIGTGIAAGSMALSASALAAPVLANSDTLATQTRLDAVTRVVAGNGGNFTQGVFTVTVTDADGHGATGAVILEEGDRAIGGAVLNGAGKAVITADLPEGRHPVRAVYQGDAAHAESVSATADASGSSGGTPDFQISLSPASLTLTQGQSGASTVSLTPVNASALSAPMFVTLSCSGFPDQSSCAFTPENVEIAQNATAAVTSDMVLATQATGTRGSSQKNVGQKGVSGAGLALLIPGAAGLLGLAGFARKGGWQRLALIALAALVASLGTTACAPRYNYYNHGPPYTLPTPAGTYNMLVTAQSSDGVTATQHTAQFVLTVNAPSSSSN